MTWWKMEQHMKSVRRNINVWFWTGQLFIILLHSKKAGLKRCASQIVGEF